MVGLIEEGKIPVFVGNLVEAFGSTRAFGKSFHFLWCHPEFEGPNDFTRLGLRRGWGKQETPEDQEKDEGCKPDVLGFQRFRLSLCRGLIRCTKLEPISATWAWTGFRENPIKFLRP